MSKDDKQEPAFPIKCIHGDIHFEGLTKKEWLAGMALNNFTSDSEATPDSIAIWAFKIADAMIEASKK